KVDFVFAGESEVTFVDFLQSIGKEPPERIIRGLPVENLDDLPTPDFADYFEQVKPIMGQVPLWLLYESSRGCWWGSKNHCPFCGIDKKRMGFRQKSPDRVVQQLTQILANSPTHRVCMTDNIMPHQFHKTLIPRLPLEVPRLRLFYEQKANLSLEQVGNLQRAGCMTIQPGIEALQSDILGLINKGVSPRQNLALLRYARIVGLQLKWNLLWGFPKDLLQSYLETETLLPLLHHLPPPQALAHMHLDRFSPYVDNPEQYGISNLRPFPGYGEVFPPEADLDRLAYHFEASYPSGSEEAPEVMVRLLDKVWRWRRAWEQHAPALELRRIGVGSFVLMDTRGLGQNPCFYLNQSQAEAVLVGGPLGQAKASKWAIRNRFAVELDGWCVPLATSTYELLAEFEGQGLVKSMAISSTP
ncbi:MAG: RiPP maturation radical SAM protein 1, partial [Proteobacteria bacterium]|nr:RiPP maturation radical SAM protein 1 [Pseudomonadota bacterium]